MISNRQYEQPLALQRVTHGIASRFLERTESFKSPEGAHPSVHLAQIAFILKYSSDYHQTLSQKSGTPLKKLLLTVLECNTCSDNYTKNTNFSRKPVTLRRVKSVIFALPILTLTTRYRNTLKNKQQLKTCDFKCCPPVIRPQLSKLPVLIV